MGCTSPTNAGVPNIPSHHLNRLLQVSQINHPLNVNKKYEHLAKIQQTSEAGAGYRKTFAYKAIVTKQELDAKRKQFWETRVSGQPIIWQAIRRAIYAQDDVTGMAILNQQKVTLLNGSIQMGVDLKFNKYEVPVFCINEPISYSDSKFEDKNLNMQYQDKTMQITIRSVKYPNGDIKLSQQASTQLQIIKSTIKAMKQLPDTTRIRLFYNGRQMMDDKTLGNYSYQTGTVIQAMIF